MFGFERERVSDFGTSLGRGFDTLGFYVEAFVLLKDCTIPCMKPGHYLSALCHRKLILTFSREIVHSVAASQVDLHKTHTSKSHEKKVTNILRFKRIFHSDFFLSQLFKIYGKN